MRLLLALLLSFLPALGLAAPLSFTIGTSEPVVVDTTGGTPLIWLNFGGGEARAATYRSGSGTAPSEFAYDIAAGDFAPVGIVAAGQIELAGGAIRDLAGNPLTLSFTPPDLSGVRVRTYRPVWTTDPITAANAAAATFEITKAPLGASFAWDITSDGGGSLSGSGTIASAPHPVTGLDLSALGDGTLTLSLTLTTAAGTSAPRTVTVTKEAPWTPATLGPALSLWLDADDASTLVLNGASVSQWQDKSGNARHVSQATLGQQPDYTPNSLNGRSVVDFVRSRSTFLDGSFPTTGISSLSIFGVTRWQTSGNSIPDIQALIDNDHADSQGFVWQDRPDLANKPLQTNGASDSQQTGDGNWKLISSVFESGVGNTLFVNAQQRKFLAHTGTFNHRPIIRIGGHQKPGEGRYFDGEFAEIIFIASVSESDRQRLEGYLAHKWGLAGSLPAGHPWKAAAP